MMSPEQIIAVNREIEARAKRNRLQPYTPGSREEIEGMPPYPFPSLGDIPDGWDEVESYFVDKTGEGKAWETALTVNQFRAELLRLFSEHPDLGYAITEEGPLQVVVSALRRVRADVADRLVQ